MSGPSAVQIRAAAATNHINWIQTLLLQPGYSTASNARNQSVKLTAATTTLPTLSSNLNVPKTLIRVIRKDTLGAARELRQKYPNDKIACLNMANSHRAGGGFIDGGRAQEEDLCHCSSLMWTLHSRFYPLQNDELIYSPNVIVVKHKDSSDPDPRRHHNVDLNPNNYFYVDVISSAANARPPTRIVQRTNNDGQQVNTQVYANHADETIMRAKIRHILDAAVANGVQRLVLAAFGCGVFRNPVGEVARIMRELLIDQSNADGSSTEWAKYGLVEIVIGIYDPSPTQDVWNGFLTQFRQGQGLHTDGGVDVPGWIQYTTFPPGYVG